MSAEQMEGEGEGRRRDCSDAARNPISITGSSKLLRYYIKTGQRVWRFRTAHIKSLRGCWPPDPSVGLESSRLCIENSEALLKLSSRPPVVRQQLLNQARPRSLPPTWPQCGEVGTRGRRWPNSSSVNRSPSGMDGVRCALNKIPKPTRRACFAAKTPKATPSCVDIGSVFVSH